jgi:glycosyltransferase involved in cell wall biosynthesis
MRLYSRILMLGAAPQTRGSIAAVVDGYRAHGLFKRWPVTYVATHGAANIVQGVKLYATAVRDFGYALGQYGPMVVHAHVSAGAGFWRHAPLMAAALAARCPLVMQLHGAGFDAVMKPFLEHAAAVCVPCEATRAWVRSVSRNAFTVLTPPPVSIEVSAQEAKPSLILFLGRLEASKGLHDLLDAVAGLRAAVPDVRLACAGEGDRAAVERHAERLGIADAVKFTGWVGPSGKRALLEHAAAFALPCYEAGMPVSLAEAMSAGVPVVASRVGGIAEVVADGTHGFLVAPGDKAGLERALRKLLLDRALAARLGAAAREAARRSFAPERALRAIETVYESVGARAPRIETPIKKPELKKAA